MVNQLLVTLVNSILGKGIPKARDNYSYKCPFCKHPTPKLEIQYIEHKKGKHRWHCWHCDKKGQSLHSLFRALKVNSSKIDELSKLVSTTFTTPIKQEVNDVVLPKEFISLYSGNNKILEARKALSYLKSRNITIEDIIKYNIGYCRTGKYKNRIIIPTYDEEGSLNYFISRTWIKDNKMKYINPSVSRNIIPNSHLINWKLPIILCEGLFDAIAVKRNVIPLLGKNIQNSLMMKIIKSKVEKIYIALDRDAMKNSLKSCEKLLNEGKEVYLVNLQEKDPSEMGFESFTKLIQTTLPLTYKGLLEQKINLI